MPEIIIPGAQTIKTYEKALKENYLPVWRNSLTVEPSPFLSKVKPLPLTSNEITAAAPQGLSGGFGYGAEGLATPAAGNVMFERFKTSAKDMYVNICISAKAVRLTGSSGAMANALDTEVKAAYETAKWNIGRSLFGNGIGILTSSKAVANSTTIEVDDIKFMKEGLIIDVFATDAPVGSEPQKTVRIKSVNRMDKTISIYGNPVTLDAGFITVQNSYGREITGIGAIFDEEIETLYGVNKKENNIIVPTSVNAQGDIDDTVIWDAVDDAETYKNSKIDTILMGKEAYKHYVTHLRDNNIRVESVSKDLKGGFKAIEYAYKNRNIDVAYEQFVPDDQAWCLDSKAFELHIQDWDFADLQGGGIFNLMENSSVYRALLANYGDLICNNPGGCVQIKNCINA